MACYCIPNGAKGKTPNEFLIIRYTNENRSMNLPLGTRVQDKCIECKQNVTGIITKKDVASFTCPTCKKEWKLNMISSKGKGSRFTVEDLKNVLEKNRNVKLQ